MIRTVVVGISVSVCLLCMGCGGRNNSGQQKVSFAEDKHANLQPPAKGAGPHAVVVTISEMKFQPQDITISKGDTVVFNNKDIVTHDITDEKSKAWGSGPIEANASWRFVPVANSHYYCTIHPVMKGSITIR